MAAVSTVLDRLVRARRTADWSLVLSWAYLAHVAVHVLLPPAVFLLPQLHTDWLPVPGHHRSLIAILLSASTLILTAGWYRHRRTRVLIWGGVGAFCMLAATGVLGHWIDGHGPAMLVGTVGSLLLAAAHWRNHRLWRRPGVQPAA